MLNHFFILIFLLLSGFQVVIGTVDFEKEILPFFEEYCFECHQAPEEKNGRLIKPKAGLRLDGVAHWMFGSDEGPILVPNHPSKSPVYNRVILPSDDDERMPPKGNLLTAEQQDLIRKWIGQGADFGSWVGATDGVSQLTRKDAHLKQRIPEFIVFYQALAQGVEEIEESILVQTGKETGLLIRPIGKKSPLLEVRVVTQHDQVGDDEIGKLSPLGAQIVKLDLRDTSISDEACDFISKFENLIELNIRACEIGDKGMKALSKLRKLKILNAGLTQLGDTGLTELKKISSLQYLNVSGCSAIYPSLDAIHPRDPGLQIVH